MTVTVRFAPSPTGFIHIGNARTALFNWLYALKHGGRFILRYDDTDLERSKAEYAEAIATDLDWLGIKPDAVYRQSDRTHLYAVAAETLMASGRLYPCYEAAEELERRRKLRLARQLPPIYGREALKLADAERSALEAEGRRPHWRFLLPNFETDPSQPRRTEMHWDDLVRGRQTVDLASLSDPVLIREDGTCLYTFTSVVDDIDLGVTHIIRGDDHVTNTGVQIALFEALCEVPPAFGHHNLLTTASGEGLSKRSGALSLKTLRETGYEPMAVVSLAVLVGTSENVAPAADMHGLLQHFNPAASSKSSAKFDPAELDVLNRGLLHGYSFDDVSGRLEAIGISGPKAEAFWLAVRGNLDFFGDAATWWKIVTQAPDNQEELIGDDLAFVRAAFDLLPEEPWDGTTWRRWTDAVKAASGRRGRALFAPLRIALTGRHSGPELSDLLPLMGRAGTLARRP